MRWPRCMKASMPPGADGLADLLKPFADALFREREDGGFGIVQDFVGGVGLLAGLGDGVVGGCDQAAQHGFVADDVDVVVDRRTVGHSVEKAGDVADVADGLQIFFAVKLFDERDDVDGARMFGQLQHARVNAAMGVEREIFGAQMLGGVVESAIVEQDGAEDGALGFDVCRHAPDGGVDGGHNV